MSRPARTGRGAPAGAGLAALAGVVAALSLPPWGWWPLGPAGVAGLAWLLGGRPARRRALLGAAFGLGFFAPGLRWLAEFSAPGSVVVVAMEAAFVALAAAAVPPGRGRAAVLPGALVLAEAVRGAVPFGGLPMAGLALGQAGSPLAGGARVGGALLVAAVVAVAGVALVEAAGRRWRAAVVAGGLAVAAVVWGAVAPDGGGGPGLRVAAVQGGGRRGFLRVEGEDPADVLARHLAASEGVHGVDLLLWPEDVVDVEGPVTATPEGADVAAVARRTGATLVVGVVEGAGPARFRNAALAWAPDGTVAGRYDKAHRVPFGEYVPGRAFFDRLADLSPIPRDAVAGRGPGLLRTPAGDVGVLISYEVFYAHLGRGAVRAGGRLLLVPTNASSYSTSQVPTQEVAAARLRAIEGGRDLVQAAPTGYSAVVDHRGRVLARSTLGRPAVLGRTLRLRAGRTLYVRAGDLPVLALAAAAVAGGWWAARRRYATPPDGSHTSTNTATTTS